MIRFLNARGHSAAEIHCQLCESYRPTAMNEGKVMSQFKEGRSKMLLVYREMVACSVRIDDLVERANVKVRENVRFTINNISLQYPEVSRATLLKIMIEILNYRNMCAQWMSKMLTDAYKDHRMISARTSLYRFNQ